MGKMRATFTQIFIHVVFSVKSRKNLIPQENLEEVFEYISGIIRNKGQKPIIVGGVSGHVHILMGLKPGVTVLAMVKTIKNNSANFINLQDWMREKFAWQNGFGAFSYGSSQVEKVSEYIKHQEELHKTNTFRDEFVAFLEIFEIDYEEKGLPPDIE
jgi:putative transposase